MKNLFAAILSIILLFTPFIAYCEEDIMSEAISASSEEIIMDPNTISEWNSQNESIFISYPLLADDLITRIKSISIIPSAKRYLKNSNGSYMETDYSYYRNLIDNINYDSITDTNNIRYGFIIKRTPLKSFPSHDEAFSSPSSVHDRFLESTLYPFEPVAILHQSNDKQWFFIKMYNYEGWVQMEDVAVTSFEVLKLYETNKNFIVITEPKAFIRYLDTELDMGCNFPLVKEHDNYYTVLCPKKGSDNSLYFTFAHIDKNDANIGYLAYSERNILSQAAKFIDEPYGWGGMNGNRDCSGLMMDIFRSMGIKLKRNTSQQEFMSPLRKDIKSMNKLEKETLLLTQHAGSLIFMDGHVMLFLGIIRNNAYILHDVTGYYADNSYINANKVTVTDVYIKNSQGYEYISLFTTFLFITE